MEFKDLIKKRRSVRRFKEDLLPRDLLRDLLETALYAPSAGNVQPWKFTVIQSNHIKEKLAAAALNQRWIAEAPTVVVVQIDLERAFKTYGQRGSSLYAIQDTAATIQTMLLYATYKGIASCWVGAFVEKEVSKILSLSSNLRPVALISLGYAAEDPPAPPRRAAEEVIDFEEDIT